MLLFRSESIYTRIDSERIVHVREKSPQSIGIKNVFKNEKELK